MKGWRTRSRMCPGCKLVRISAVRALCEACQKAYTAHRAEHPHDLCEYCEMRRGGWSSELGKVICQQCSTSGIDWLAWELNKSKE